MAPKPDSAGAGEASQASSSSSQPPSRVRRRARKRNGPPQLQFLTATDPSQFKDENAKRSVRSQAMIHYRNKAAEQKKKGKEKVITEAPLAGTPAPVAERITPIVTNEGAYEGRQIALMSQVLDEHQEEQHLYPSTSAAWWGTNPDEGFGEPSWYPAQSTLMPAPSSRYHQALSAVPLNAAAEKVIEYEDTDAHEEKAVRMLVGRLARYQNIDDGVDPFMVLPQFKSPELNSVYLVRKCQRAFVSPQTIIKWLPAMLSHPHILLSSTILASTWLDMHAGCSGDSKRTVLVKGETIGYINGRLRDPTTQFDDSTLMVILHLLAGEMWSCNEKTLRIHESGVARLIHQRGGMHRLGGEGVMAQVSAACCYHCDIFCEATPLPIFYSWEPLGYTPIGETLAIPESPLFAPRSEFFTILKDPQCSQFTYDLLSDMRDLTDLFLAHNAGLNTVLDVEAEEDHSRLGPSLLDYDTKVSEIRYRLVSLPSAYTPGLPTTNDWIYEACRIAALIYASAIIMRVPFSVAADPTRNTIFADTASLTNSLAGGHLLSARLTEVLYEVLEKTDTSNVWNDMSGVLYWVAIVGAAAARTPVSINMSQQPKSRSEAYAIWVRRCLIMFATKVMIILIFQHPLPIIMAQKRMLKVQEMIGSGTSRRLVS